LTNEEKCEVPPALSRCNCIAQVYGRDGSECLSPGSGPCDDVSDRPGITPLHVACRHADLAVVQFLLERGAAVNAVTVIDSYTPLQVNNPVHSVSVLVTFRVPTPPGKSWVFY